MGEAKKFIARNFKIVLREDLREGETTADIRLEGIEEAPKSLKEDLIGDFSYFDVSISGMRRYEDGDRNRRFDKVE